MEVNTSVLRNAGEEFKRYATYLQSVSEEVAYVRYELSQFSKIDDIRWFLRKTEDRIERLSHANTDLSNALINSAERYESSEKSVAERGRVTTSQWMRGEVWVKATHILKPHRINRRMPWMVHRNRFRFRRQIARRVPAFYLLPELRRLPKPDDRISRLIYNIFK